MNTIIKTGSHPDKTPAAKAAPDRIDSIPEGIESGLSSPRSPGRKSTGPLSPLSIKK